MIRSPCLLLLFLLCASNDSRVVAQTTLENVGPTLGSPRATTHQSTPADSLRTTQNGAEDQNSKSDGKQETAAKPTSAGLDLQKQMAAVEAQQAAAKQRTEQLESDKKSVAAALEKLQSEGLEEQPPYSFLVLDSLKDALKTQTELVESHENSEESSYEALESAKQAAGEKNNKLVDLREALAASKDAGRKQKLKQAQKQAELESKIANAEVALRSTERATEKLNQQIEAKRLELLKAKLSIVQPQAMFSKSDLQQRLRGLNKQEDSLTRERQSTNLNIPVLNQKWSDARSKLRAAGGDGPVLGAEVRARQQERDAASDQVAMLSQQLGWLAEAKAFWNHRYNLAQGNYSSKEFSEWLDESDDMLSEMSTERQKMELRQQDVRRQLAEVAGEVQSVQQGDGAELGWLKDRQTTLRSQIDAITDHLVRMDAIEGVAEKLAADVNQRRPTFNLREWAASVWERVADVWNYILVQDPAGGDALAIRVKTVVKGLFLLVIGIWISRRLSHLLGKRMLPKFGVHEGAASALQSLAFYALVLTSALMALRYVHVPLTLFTFLGGAVAIGLGFGSQNILNNFISGIILLVEQPVRVGDLVELLGLTGTVEQIGMRSTRIRTPQNQEMIVPNSSFLENNVLNWTLTDSTIRCFVEVGVAYGSPTREVARWMRQAAEKHGMVRQKPEPFVWFTGFGDNTLNFELHFYLVVRTLAERRRIESDLRFMIDQNFRDAGIVIAFPQRDVHLDTDSPLEIRMMPPKEPDEDEEQKPSKIGSPDSRATKPTGMTPIQVKAMQAKIAKEKKEAKEAE